MLLFIALVLLLLWIAGVGLAVAGSLIHILLVLAVIVVVLHFFRGRTSRSP